MSRVYVRGIKKKSKVPRSMDTEEATQKMVNAKTNLTFSTLIHSPRQLHDVCFIFLCRPSSLYTIDTHNEWTYSDWMKKISWLMLQFAVMLYSSWVLRIVSCESEKKTTKLMNNNFFISLGREKVDEDVELLWSRWKMVFNNFLLSFYLLAAKSCSFFRLGVL
jgi:hypothetical protein